MGMGDVALLPAMPLWGGLALLVLGAALAGVVNTLAGGGSLLVVPLLIALGLPPTTANGTLRVGVVVQNLSALATFHARGEREYGVVARLAVAMMVGAGIGSYLATRIADAWLQPVFGGLIVVWAIVLTVRPGGFVAAPTEVQPVRALSHALAFGVGVYGGLLQVAVGFPLLALLTAHLGYGAVRANSIKVALVLVYTLVALPVFVLADQVAWREGGALAIGSLFGGWLGTRLQIRRGANLVRWVVVITAVASGAAMVIAGIGELL
jgi:uncharacterized protein